MNIIEQINADKLNRNLPEFNAGVTVIVNVKVKEDNRERLQAFEGIVIANKEPRPEFCFHRAQDFARHGRRARFPDPQPFDRFGESEASR